MKLSDLVTTTTPSSVINTKLEDSEQNLDELYKIYKTPARSIKASKSTSSGGIVGSESTTPYSSSHSTSSTGITVLENTQTGRSGGGDFDQDLNLNDFDLCVDEENDGDDEFDESLNLDETSLCDEDFDKTTTSAKQEEYDSLSQKTLSSSIEAFKHDKSQG